jgi:hypothetical protein
MRAAMARTAAFFTINEQRPSGRINARMGKSGKQSKVKK